MDRSYLFAPGHNEKLLGKVFDAGADAVMLDLEDAVPPEGKERARRWWPRPRRAPAWSASTCRARSSAPPTSRRSATLPTASGSRRRVCRGRGVGRGRAPGKPIICAIESARGLLAAAEIAAAPGVRFLDMGGIDLRRDLNADAGNLPTLYVRSHIVVASRAAGSAAGRQRLSAARRRRRAARAGAVRPLAGFVGKSAIHPRQLPILHEVFAPAEDLEWAREVLSAFEAARRGVPAPERRVRRRAGGRARSADAGDRGPPVEARPPGSVNARAAAPGGH